MHNLHFTQTIHRFKYLLTPLLALFFLTSPAGTLQAKAVDFDPEQALQLSRDAMDRPMAEYTLRNRLGRQINLTELTKGKPYILSLIYTSCYHTCSVATRSLAEVVKKAQDTYGIDSFKIITIGFDTRFDKPRAMASFARQQDLEDHPNWFFFSGTKATVGQIITNVGFTYMPSPRGFDHLVQATVVDAKGVIYRQVYGETISTPLLLEPLKELILGQPPGPETVVENLVRRVKLFCTSYDPTQDAYRFDFSIFINMFIGGTIILTGIVLVYKELKKSKKRV
ncbi:MAG: SCO family protein [Magnetococcales bacterium]|nr:SCO family protein [Magnetococcales bacterium]